MMVVLKIPVIAAFALVWWAVREPEPAEAPDDDDRGGSDREAGSRPRRPGPPRRGPHGAPAPGAPRRVRTVAAPTSVRRAQPSRAGERRTRHS